MSAAATQPTPHGGPGPHGADTQGSGQVLQYIINVGADFVRLLHEQALAHAAQQATVLAQHGAPPAQHAAAPTPQAKDTPQATDAQPAPAPQPAPPPAPDALIRTAASFDQIARAVRRTIALAQSLNAPKQQPATPPAQDRTTARRRILRAVEDVIQRPPDNDECDDAETLLADLYERMDAPDLDDDIATRPPEDIIKEILRDLGLAALPGSRPWKRRTQADIAGLNAHAAAPASPARSAARPPGPGPQDGNSAATGQPAFGPEPDGREPGPPKPAQPEPAKAAAARSAARPPVRPGHTLPEDPAEAVAFVLRQAARTDARWRPPPDD